MDMMEHTAASPVERMAPRTNPAWFCRYYSNLKHAMRSAASTSRSMGDATVKLEDANHFVTPFVMQTYLVTKRVNSRAHHSEQGHQDIFLS